MFNNLKSGNYGFSTHQILQHELKTERVIFIYFFLPVNRANKFVDNELHVFSNVRSSSWFLHRLLSQFNFVSG